MTPLQENQLEHAHMLSQQWPTPGIFVMAAVALAVWFGSHWLSRRIKFNSPVSWAMFLIRVLIGAVALWLLSNALNRVIVLATGWWIPGLCLFVAVSIELVLAFYFIERKFVSSRIGKSLAALRVALVLVLGLMLLQPVFAWVFEKTHDRYIAILIDDSQSMQIVDQLTDEEKTRLQKLLGDEEAEPADNLPRSAIVRELLAGNEKASRKGLIDKLGEEYKIRLFRFNREAGELNVDQWLAGDASLQDEQKPANEDSPEKKINPDTKDSDSPENGYDGDATSDAEGSNAAESVMTLNPATRTDIATALSYVNREIARENLAGVLLVSDGQHNGADDARAIAARLGAGNVPVSAAVVGSSRPPIDAAIVDVQTPASVQEGDLLSVRTRVRVEGMKGRKFRAILINDEKKVAERTIHVTSDEFDSTVELLHKTTTDGIVAYRVELEPVGDSIEEQAGFEKNNRQEFSVAVTDNRSEVLLIEGRPRWEFGYLRNLFAGRDESIQLQTVLLEPDRLDPTVNRPSVFASASREAGEEEASLLPQDETEWLKFDVIIIGDVRPDAFTAEQYRILQKFVSRRGGTLIVIAGQRNMPHRFADTSLAEMLPVEFDPIPDAQFESPETSFHFQLTSLGRQHPVTQLAETDTDTDEIWRNVPEMYWRHAIRAIKPGGRVLAYASVAEQEKQFQPIAGESDEQAKDRRRKMEEYQQKNALIAISQFGAGRVMMLNTDRTWRLRYRVGDVYHHRFWGQIMRWANAEKLQGGTDFVRVGTQRTSYLPGESIVVSARLTDEKFSPIEDENAKVKVFLDEKLILTRKLDPVADNPGMYRADLGGLNEAGGYRIELDSPAANTAFSDSASENGKDVKTNIVVRPADDFSSEMTATVADRQRLTRITAAAGGTMVEIDETNSLLDDFAESSGRYIESHSVRLWDSWPLLLLMVLLITAEWILRKKGGLV